MVKTKYKLDYRRDKAPPCLLIYHDNVVLKYETVQCLVSTAWQEGIFRLFPPGSGAEA